MIEWFKSLPTSRELTMHSLKVFLLLLPIFLLIDLLWLGVFMKDFYNHELGELARREGIAIAPRWGAAILVYLLTPGGLVLFVRPLLGESSTTWQAFCWGALFGLVVYGVYDLTNLSVIEKWSLRMTVADMVWGCVLCGTMSVIMQAVDGWLAK